MDKKDRKEQKEVKEEAEGVVFEEEEEDEEEDDSEEDEEEEEEDDEEEEEEEEAKPQRKRAKRSSLKKKTFFGSTSNTVHKEVQKYFHDYKWMFRASFIVRACIKDKTPYFEWIQKMCPYLSDVVKLDLFLVALDRGNAILATNVYLALHCPTHLFGRDFVSVLETQCISANAIVNMIQGISNSPEAAVLHGNRHVLFKLRTITEPITQLEISRSLSRKRIPFEILHLLEKRELSYLKEQKFRISVAELVDYAYRYDMSKVIDPYARSAWLEVIKTFPALEDTPYSTQPLILKYHTPNTDRDFFQNRVSDFALTSYKTLSEECPSLDHKQTSDCFKEIEPNKLQKLLALIHKSPALLKSTFAKRTLNGLRFICLFRKQYWHVMIQVLMQPELITVCACVNEKLNDIRKQRAHRHCRPDSIDAGRTFHTCCPVPKLIKPLVSQFCAPWYKPDFQGHGVSGNEEWCSLVLQDRLSHPYSLTNKGRVIVISHFLTLLYWNQVPATTCMILAEVVLSLKKQCLEKTYREAFTIISSLELKPEKTKQTVDSFLDSSESPQSNYLQELHELILKNKETPETKILLRLYEFVETSFC